MCVNGLWPQEQCTKKLVPLVKTPGEHNTADLMTKHSTTLMVKRHIATLCLEFKDDRAEKAAKMHSVTRNSRVEAAQSKLRAIDEGFASVAGGDYWSEKGEEGRWVRIPVTPRTSAFLPWKVPGGPGRKTRLTTERSTRGVDSCGRQFRVDDSCDDPTVGSLSARTWTGRTVLLVDKIHDDRWGTDQRRPWIEVGSLRESVELQWHRLTE